VKRWIYFFSFWGATQCADFMQQHKSISWEVSCAETKLSARILCYFLGLEHVEKYHTKCEKLKNNLVADNIYAAFSFHSLALKDFGRLWCKTKKFNYDHNNVLVLVAQYCMQKMRKNLSLHPNRCWCHGFSDNRRSPWQITDDQCREK